MTRDAAHWGSWADCLEMIAQRHPPVAEAIVNGVGTASGCFASVVAAIARLQDVGVEIPTRQVLALGLRPPHTNDEREPSQPRHGWQKYASAVVQKFHREQVVLPSLSPAEQAMVRSQSGPLASVPFTAMPFQRVSRIDSEEFRVLVMRRLRLPLPLSVRSCRCGRTLDVLGHHRAACSTAGVLGRRGFAVENAVAQICREGGARVSTNVFLRDLDISPVGSTDSRRLEVVECGSQDRCRAAQ